MVQIKGHRHKEKRRRQQPWPRKFVPKHHEGKCPYCQRHIKNIEAHINLEHKTEKPGLIKGKLHGRD